MFEVEEEEGPKAIMSVVVSVEQSYEKAGAIIVTVYVSYYCALIDRATMRA